MRDNTRLDVLCVILYHIFSDDFQMLLLILLASQFNLMGIQGESSLKGPAQRPSVQNISELRAEMENTNIPCDLGAPASWLGEDLCGVNCIYMMLQMHNKGITYDELIKKMGTIPKGGISIQKMAEVCKFYGLNATVLQAPIEQIRQWDPPAIIHLGDPQVPGHFIFYFKDDKKNHSLYFVDGTTGIPTIAGGSRNSPLTTLVRSASGYILVIDEETSFFNSTRCLIISTLVCACVWFVVYQKLLAVKKTKSNRGADQ